MSKGSAGNVRAEGQTEEFAQMDIETEKLKQTFSPLWFPLLFSSSLTQFLKAKTVIIIRKTTDFST